MKCALCGRALRKRGVTADYVTDECADRDEKIRRFK
jgi:hypothetical protein